MSEDQIQLLKPLHLQSSTKSITSKTLRILVFIAILICVICWFCAVMYTNSPKNGLSPLEIAVYNHPEMAIGVPFSGLGALFIVFFLENTSGSVEFEGLGFKFKGASGPIVFFIMCFLSLILAVKVLW